MDTREPCTHNTSRDNATVQKGVCIIYVVWYGQDTKKYRNTSTDSKKITCVCDLGDVHDEGGGRQRQASM